MLGPPYIFNKFIALMGNNTASLTIYEGYSHIPTVLYKLNLFSNIFDGLLETQKTSEIYHFYPINYIDSVTPYFIYARRLLTQSCLQQHIIIAYPSEMPSSVFLKQVL